MLDRLLARVDELVELADQVAATKYEVSTSSWSKEILVAIAPFHEWLAASQSFLIRVFGERHTHSKLFVERCKAARLGDLLAGQAILRASKQDLSGGFLKSLESIVEADIFSDFLVMVDHLLERGYKDPAASLLGAVLEDGLRRIARRNDVDVRDKDDLQSLNTKLADREVYSRLTQKRVKVWTDLRNHADHGEFAEYTISLVREMRMGVGDFLAAHLTPSPSAG